MKQINADNEFACVEEEITPVKMNIVAAGQHVGDVERSIRTIKEGTRYHVHRLPYRRYPACMIRGCLIKVVKERNNLPAENGVSRTVSPCTMIMGRPPPDYNEVIKLNFGDYVQTHNVRSRTNDNEQRTVGAIALYPTENGQGSWVFMSLVTGKEIHRYQWEILPISEEVIMRVEELAKGENQPLVSSNFKYEWREEVDLNDQDDLEEEHIEIGQDFLPQPKLLPLNGEDSTYSDESMTLSQPEEIDVTGASNDINEATNDDTAGDTGAEKESSTSEVHDIHEIIENVGAQGNVGAHGDDSTQEVENERLERKIKQEENLDIHEQHEVETGSRDGSEENESVDEEEGAMGQGEIENEEEVKEEATDHEVNKVEEPQVPLRRSTRRKEVVDYREDKDLYLQLARKTRRTRQSNYNPKNKKKGRGL